MRLDHLLSKETSSKTMILLVTSYRSVQGYEKVQTVALFNLEGTGKDVPKKEVKLIWANSSAG